MNGKAHATASLVLALPCGVAAYAVTENVAVSVGATVGCLAGTLLTPDLDVDGITSSEWWLVKKLGPLGFLWMAAWWPYAKIIPHRHWLSHAPIVGTIGRLAYVLLPVVLLCVALGVELPEIPLVAWHAIAGAVRGLMVSDTAHWLMDL